MNLTVAPFSQPKAYCITKQCACEHANTFGYCAYTIACVKGNYKPQIISDNFDKTNGWPLYT